MKGSYHRRKLGNKNAKILIGRHHAFTFEKQMIIDLVQTSFEAGFAHAKDNDKVISNFSEEMLMRIIANEQSPKQEVK